MAPRTFLFSIVLGAEYLSYVKFIATYALTFFGYIILVLASVPLLIFRFMWFLHSWIGVLISLPLLRGRHLLMTPKLGQAQPSFGLSCAAINILLLPPKLSFST